MVWIKKGSKKENRMIDLQMKLTGRQVNRANTGRKVRKANIC